MDEAFLAILGIGLVALIVLTPIVALFLASAARRDLRTLRATIEDLRERAARSEWWIGELSRRIAAPPTATTTSTSTATATPTPTSTSTATSAEHPTTTEIPAAAIRATAFEAPSADPHTSSGASTGTGTSGGSVGERFDFEKLVGVRLFAWLGGIGLFIGAAFFLEYSIEHDLISPPLRVGIGLLVGAVAIALGDYLRTKADRAGQALGGAGIATLHASLFAARSLYRLIPNAGAFAGMALVTLVAGLIAVRRDAFVLAVIGLIGGFATPWLLSTGEDHRYALFSYVMLLDLGVLAVAAMRRWVSLTALALVGSMIIYTGWGLQYLDSQGVPFALAVAAILAAVFVASFLWRDRHESRPRMDAILITAVALACPFLAAIAEVNVTAYSADVTLLVGYLAILSVGVLVVVRRWRMPFFMEAAATLVVVTLYARLGSDLFPAHRTPTLLSYSLVPFLLFGFQALSRGRPEEMSLRTSAGIGLAGSLIVASQVVVIENTSEPILPLGLYVGFHVAGLIAIGLLHASGRWLAIAQAVFFGTLLALTQRFEAARLYEFVPLIVVPMVLFFALPLVTPRARADRAGWFAAAAALVLHYGLLYALARNIWPDAALGAGAVVAGAVSLGMMVFARKNLASDAPNSIVALLGGVTLLFLAAAVPIALSKQWITVAWALEAAALAWLYLRIVHRGLLAASASLALATVVRLIANPSLWEYHPRSGAIVVNWYLYTFGVPALALFGAAYLLRNDRAANTYRYPMSFWFAGGVLLFVLLNVEIADAYSTGQTIGFHLGASLGEDMTYSLGWGFFGLATLILGMGVRSTKARVSALLVLLLAIGKVFLHDLWHLGSLYRVGSMVGLAVALLVVSFLTQRFALRGDRS